MCADTDWMHSEPEANPVAVAISCCSAKSPNALGMAALNMSWLRNVANRGSLSRLWRHCTEIKHGGSLAVTSTGGIRVVATARRESGLLARLPINPVTT